MSRLGGCFVVGLTLGLIGCGGEVVGIDAGVDAPASIDAGTAFDTAGLDAFDAIAEIDALVLDAAPVDGGAPRAPIDAARDRLLATYLARLDARPDVVQSNGLRGADVSDVCALWSAMPPSSQSVFLTITARLGGSRLGADGASVIDHVTTLHRVAGGGDESATDIGSCGGGENNRVFVSIDATLHAALVAGHDREGAALPSGARDVDDVIAESFWRDTQDLAGPHHPFTISLETEGGTPRGQVHFFRDPMSTEARAPLERTDVEDLVDGYALEIDQDYDCVHASNPLCEYRLYGPACAPRERKTGVAMYADTYGPIDLGWRPAGC